MCPYIDPDHRPAIDHGITDASRHILTAGDLNYAITRLCLAHIDSVGMGYATLNRVVGVLECAKLELYARVVRPYEDRKIAENGDVL